VESGLKSDQVVYFPKDPSLTLPPQLLQSAAAGEPLPHLPGFEVLRELGRGGMGVVYLARQTALNRLVALKMVAGDFTHTDAQQRFVAEAESIAQLQHPGIVQIYACGSHEGHPYLALEYVPHGSLADYLTGNPLAAREAAGLVAHVAQAVQVAHDKGIIHRDLKPANILLAVPSGQGPVVGKDPLPGGLLTAQPKLTDFGLAKRQDSTVTASGIAVGTPCYMSPEQAAGRRALGPTTDVYALGVILYELLTGRPPFKAASPLDTMMQVMQEEVLSPRRLCPAIPADLETICLKCLEKEPTKRYPSAAALAADLQRYLQGEPILARPAGRGERVLKWARRKPALAGLLATALLTLLILSGSMVLLLMAWQQAETNARLAWEKEQEARTARNQAEAHAQQARAAQQQAEEHFRMSRRVVGEVLLAVTETQLLQQPTMREVRKLLLEKAVPLFERMLMVRKEDASTLDEAARSYERLAYLTYEIGQLNKAKDAYRQALRLREQLATARPDSPECQAEMADVWNRLGVLHFESAEHEAAARCWQEALRLRERLISAHPGQPSYQMDLAESWNNLAALRLQQQRIPEAEECWQKTLRLRARLVMEQPESARRLSDLAGTWNNLGVLQRDQGRFQEAEQSLQQARQIYEKLVAAQPTLAEFQADLAGAWNNLGILHVLAGQRPEAERCYRQAVQLREKVATSNPGVIPFWIKWGMSCNNLGLFQLEATAYKDALNHYEQAIQILTAVRQRDGQNLAARQNLHAAYCGRAEVLGYLGRATEALGECDKALALKVYGPRDRQVALLRGRLQAKAQDVAAAQQTLQELRQLPNLEGPTLVALARITALCLAATPHNTTAVDTFTTQAMELLQQAQDRGWFTQPQHWEAIEKEPDFATLRQRPEYQRWREHR
jgi:tetratricopeptide (TPR) repeat protein